MGMNPKIVKVIDLVPGTVQALKAVPAESLDSKTFWDEYVCRHVPLVIKGAAKEWPVLEKWKQPGYLESRCGDERAGMSRTFNPLPSTPYFQNAVNFKKLSECIAEMRAAPEDATHSIPAMKLPQEWVEDLGKFSFFEERGDLKPRFYPYKRFFVYRNASTEWHYHPIDESLTTQLVGAKKFSMFRLNAAAWTRYVPPIEANFHHMDCGQQFFPRDSANLIKYEAILEPGDTIYIPPFWWHGVDPVDNDFGVTLAHCFRTPLRRFGDWKEPATRLLLKKTLTSERKWILPIFSLVAGSSISRYVAGEKW
jgi:hypothetical protein